MTRLLTTTAFVLAFAGQGLAQSVQTEVGTSKMSADSILISDMIGAPVYNFRGKPVNDRPMPLDGANRFEEIATVKDVMINASGEVEAIVMSVGGFWGLADREVTAAMDGLTVVTDVRGDRYFVIFTDEDTLDDAPRFDKFDVRSASQTAAAADDAPKSVGQDPDAEIDKAKPADEMEGDTAPNGTDLTASESPATEDGVPRDAETPNVGTANPEAEVGIPEEEEADKS